MKNIQFKAIEFKSAKVALQHTEVEGGAAINLAGRYFVVSETEAVRMAQADFEFAYLCEHDAEDSPFRIMAIPSN